MTISNTVYKCVDMELSGDNVVVKLAIKKDGMIGTYSTARDITLVLTPIEADQFEIGKEYTPDFTVVP